MGSHTILTYRELLFSAEPQQANPSLPPVPIPSTFRDSTHSSDTGLASNRSGTRALISSKRDPRERRLFDGLCAHPCSGQCRCVCLPTRAAGTGHFHLRAT